MESTERRFDLPIVDHHAHLRPGPHAKEEVRKFERMGGTHLFLTTQNYREDPPVTLEDYRDQFLTTLRLADTLRAETTVGIYVVLAPFPVDLVSQVPLLGLGPAEALQRDALRLAGNFIREGKALALGEVGRPHFPVEPHLMEAAQRTLVAALETARDLGCPVVLHTEDLTSATYQEMGRLARGVSLPIERMIKHYARQVTPVDQRDGLTPSYLAKRDLVMGTLRDPGPWFLETDYLDDPTRPGAVLPLETIPRRVRWLLQMAEDPGAPRPTGAGPDDLDPLQCLRIPFLDAPERVYHLRLERHHPLEPHAMPPSPGHRLRDAAPGAPP